jgi:hypothetical protein
LPTSVHEWLTDHTWIAWHIRDGLGNLRPVWDGAKSKACDSLERRWKGHKDVSSDIEFANLQEEALKKLGTPNEDDFSKWTKEQEQAEKEIRYVELERRLVKIPNHYEDDPPRHHHHHIQERRW